MSISNFELKKNAHILSLPWEGLADASKGRGRNVNYWIEADASSVEELELELRNMDVHPLIFDDFLEPEHSTLVDRYPESIYIELPTNADPDQSDISYLSIVCLSSLMITMRRGEIPGLPRLVKVLEEEEKLELGNSSNLLYKIIDYFIEGTINQNLDYRREINRLEERLPEQPETINPNELASLRRRLTQLESICVDQLYCTTSLITHRHKVIDMKGQEAYFNDLVTDAEHTLRMVNRLGGRLKDLQDNLQLQHQDSTEKRLRILTIFSAIFLPLTFITGFFGMNFVNMRLFEWAFGLLFFTGLMVAITLILMWFFYRRGWFD